MPVGTNISGHKQAQKVIAMNETCIMIVARMVVNMMAGEREQFLELYEEYNRERYLFVTIGEILRAKKERIA
jgi:hypothetical protein